MPFRSLRALAERILPPRPSVSSVGISSQALIRLSMYPSLMRRAKLVIRSAGRVWEFRRKSSTNPHPPPHDARCSRAGDGPWIPCVTASFALRSGRSAYCSGGRSASKIGSNTSRAAARTRFQATRSRIQGIPRGRKAPGCFFGILTGRTGLGVSVFSRL